MFSIMTMASSTTKPVEIVSAIRVRLFRLYPSRYITPNVPTSESGTATLGITVAREIAQENKDHHDDQADGDHQFEQDIFDRRADGLVRSVRNGDLDRRGERRLQLGNSFLMRSATLMILAPGCR